MPIGIYLHKSRSEETKLKQKTKICKTLNKPVDDIERFWSNVDIKGLFDCWEWKGYLNNGGYGTFRFNGKIRKAHRIAYELYYGPVPDDLFILHKCNNRTCENYFHLYAGTKQDNYDDMIKANRQVILYGESHGMAKLTKKQIIEIRENKDNLSYTELGKHYKVARPTIACIIKNKTWKHIPSS